ncbi:Dabb family protein [Acidicapsa ligni]|uniref:Dabb family protein n=1 Tax=Acidicapsa ligni TaxID=542300 RepID=UPI0021DFCA41|nr:Dabb family protein [Acidicapsa ligni]
MYYHIFGFKWKAKATETDKANAATDILAFQGAIPGLIETHFGPNTSAHTQGYTVAGVMKFQDKASLDAYQRHPSHLALLDWLVPLIDAVELDIEV